MKNAMPARIYVMENDDGLVKLGRSLDPDKRRRTLESGTGRNVHLCHTTPLRDDSSYVEAAAHRILADKRKAGEWFDVTVDDAVQAIEAAIRDVERWKDGRKCKKCRPLPIIWPKTDKQKCRGCTPMQLIFPKSRRKLSFPKIKRGPGRPPKYDSGSMGSAITIRLPRAMIECIDQIRANRSDAPDRATIIRELLAKALEQDLAH